MSRATGAGPRRRRGSALPGGCTLPGAGAFSGRDALPGAATLVVVAALTAGAALAGCGRSVPEGGGTFSVAATLSAADTGYARALAPRTFHFPADQGPHPRFRDEWWYFTGNLATPSGRRFGFELTFFRNALTPHPRARPSDWAASQAYMAHFALTDVARDQFHAFQRFDRGALGLAGAQAKPLRVWVEDWQVAQEPASPGRGSAGERGAAVGAAGEERTSPAAAATPPLRLHAAADDVAITLRLRALSPPVLNGDSGLSRKGPEPGNASYYYSVPRLAARGRIRTAQGSFPVAGLVWLDREWSTSALSPGDVGWDWLGLQLSDGTDLLYYRLRRRDGGASPFSAGTLVRGDTAWAPAHPGAAAASAAAASGAAANGVAASGAAASAAAADGRPRVSHLGPGQVELRATGTWRSPADGRVYPSGWRVAVPADSLELTVTPLVKDQELRLAFRYWEGAVRVTGRHYGRAVSGYGYVELVGYH